MAQGSVLRALDLRVSRVGLSAVRTISGRVGREPDCAGAAGFICSAALKASSDCSTAGAGLARCDCLF